MYGFRDRISRYTVRLYGWMIFFKLSLEFSYVYWLAPRSSHFVVNFNGGKYIYGFLWLIVLFFGIRHERKTASSFFLLFLFVFQLLPLTVIYEMCDESTAYYSYICAAVAVCEYIVVRIGTIPCNICIAGKSQERFVTGMFCLVFGFFMAYVYQMNGFPTTAAFNIYDVYKLRSSGAYQLGHFGGYLQVLVTKVIAPILLTKFLLYRQYCSSLLVLCGEFLIYLYSGNKSFLFAPILIIGVVEIIRRDSLRDRFWMFVCGGMSVLCIGAGFAPLIFQVYSLFIRRALFLPAALSYHYFDFFSTHPLEGIARLFPYWLIPVESYYGSGYPDGYTFQIAAIYYNSPMMNANNGFFSEGFLRWGVVGIFIILIVFALFLKLIDGFQDKTSYTFALGCCVYTIYGLNDAHILRAYMVALVLALLLVRADKECHERGCDRARLFFG